MANASPGLFVGYRLETGLRYRGVLMIADYETLREDHFEWRRVKSIHEKEVMIPEELGFPFC